MLSKKRNLRLSNHQYQIALCIFMMIVVTVAYLSGHPSVVLGGFYGFSIAEIWRLVREQRRKSDVEGEPEAV